MLHEPILSMGTRALIFGVSGQDGALLAKFLLGKGYQVWGGVRALEASRLENLRRLQIASSIELVQVDVESRRGIQALIESCAPQEIYFLAAQSSVGMSFVDPESTVRSGVLGILNVLEAVRAVDWSIRVFFAGSGDCFGDTGGVGATECTPYSPVSPYAVSKASGAWLVRNYRENFGLHACTGILFNHESVLRPERFVTQKVIAGAFRIAQGEDSKLVLGRLDIWRDWGWAPEYVDAMWRMLQLSVAEDFVLATGRSYMLRDFVSAAFALHGLAWEDHVIESSEFSRPSDIVHSHANPAKAFNLLAWKPECEMHDVVRFMSAALQTVS